MQITTTTKISAMRPYSLVKDQWAEVRAANGEAELILYGDIGEDIWGDESNTAKSVVEALTAVKGMNLTVRINSYGGSVADGLAIHNAIRRNTGDNTVEIDGVAFSIASLIAMAGDTVRMAENALMMVHAPWTRAIGNAPEFRRTADELDRYSQAMASSYARKTGKSGDEILSLLTDGDDHYFTAEEAVDFGLADEITDGVPVAASFDFRRFRRLPAAAAAFTKPIEAPSMDDPKVLEPQVTEDPISPDPVVDPTPEDAERALINAAIREIAASVKNSIPEAEAIAERMISIDASEADYKAELRASLKNSRPESVQATPRQPRIEQRLRYKSMKGFQTEEQAYRAGMWARATFFKDPQAKRWCKDYGVQAALSGVTTLGGGVLVPEEMSQSIIDLREEYGVARRACEIVPMNSDSLTTPRKTAYPTATFEGESTSATEDETEWDSVTLVAKKIRTLTKIPRELAEDAVIDLASDTSMSMASAFAQTEDDCLFNGDGTSTYGGIYGIRAKIIDGNHAAGAVDAASGHDTFGEIDNDDLTAVIAALPEYAAGGAAWYCSKRADGLTFSQLKAAAGGNTVITLEGRPRRAYLGDPIVVSQVMPSGATTDYSNVAMIVYGDISMGAKLGDRRGFSVQVLEERYADADQIGIIGRERFDIVVHSLGDGTTAGPIVALIGE